MALVLVGDFVTSWGPDERDGHNIAWASWFKRPSEDGELDAPSVFDHGAISPGTDSPAKFHSFPSLLFRLASSHLLPLIRCLSQVKRYLCACVMPPNRR